jgi:hypothetical protein
LQEVKARQCNQQHRGVGEAVTRLVHSVTYNKPARTERFSSNDPNSVRVYNKGRLTGVLGAETIQHVIQARLPDGRYIRLPDGVTYDKALQFASMSATNRRLHWKGETTTYSAMLEMVLSDDVRLAERAGKGFKWRDDSPLDVRLRWVRQFAPPNRIR